MPDTVLKVFSYLPNPRVWKAQIAADIIGVGVETVGDKPMKLAEWLWDFNPRPLEAGERTEDSPHARKSYRGFTGTLFKTDAFLLAHPFGTVPAAFSPDGSVGVFESNSILRAVARSGGDHNLYGNDGYEASRIDSFLDPNSSKDLYQIEKSLDSFRDGGLFGKGPGEGSIKAQLPDAHADFIFAVIGEEFGMIACAVVLLLVGFIVLRCLFKALRATDPFVGLTLAGLSVQFGLQAAINMATALNLIPTKGMTLPFVSYGGTSLLATGLAMGVVLSLTRSDVPVEMSAQELSRGSYRHDG